MKAPAWIIAITNELLAAVGEFELIHVLPDVPTLFKIPKTPDDCSQVLIWQNRIIPVLNLAARLANSTEQGSIIGIFAYRTEQQAINYGALFINGTPKRITVSDEQASPLPVELQAWASYIRCCFQDSSSKQVIPILKLEQLFAAYNTPLKPPQ